MPEVLRSQIQDHKNPFGRHRKPVAKAKDGRSDIRPTANLSRALFQFSCEIGICEGEIIDLLKADVHITEKADDWGHYGYLQIRKGKTEFRKRSLPITPRAKEILTAWMAKSKSDLFLRGRTASVQFQLSH